MKRFVHLHMPQARWQAAVLAGLGSALAVGVLAYLSEITKFIMLVAPFGASCVLMFAMPAAPVSQPANVIGGHILAAAIGVALHFIVPVGFLGDALAVGLSVAAMMLLRVVHPPAGATALIAYLTATSWWFLVFPIAVGSLLLVAAAALYHQVVKTNYPLPVPKP